MNRLSITAPRRTSGATQRVRLFAAVVTATAALLAACSGGGGGDQAPSSTASAPAPTNSSLPPVSEPLLTNGGPPTPATGAYLGAWVNPNGYGLSGDTARSEAAAAFEVQLGRKLDIVHNYHRMNDPFPDANDLAVLNSGSYLLLSWAGASSADILAGTYDDLIRTRALALKQYGDKVFLRWRWEMNRPFWALTVGTPADYVAAWRHVHDIFTSVGSQPAWVWCPIAYKFTETNAPEFYPGDSYVDWICSDPYPSHNDYEAFSVVNSAFTNWARTIAKPVMIGETGVSPKDPTLQKTWLEDMAATIRADPQIKAVVYFEEKRDDKTSQQVWDYRLADNPTALSEFSSLAKDPYFNINRLVAPPS